MTLKFGVLSRAWLQTELDKLNPKHVPMCSLNKKMEKQTENTSPNGRNIDAGIEDRLIRRREVLRRTGLSSTALDRLERSGKFPIKVTIGPRAVAWSGSEVNAWIDARKADRKIHDSHLYQLNGDFSSGIRP